MGRGGRSQTTRVTGGVLSGIVSGAVWGSLVGGLVLLLAALVLDLEREPSGPAPEASDDTVGAEPIDAIKAAPVLLQRLDAFMPPEPEPDRPMAPSDPQRSLVPRPAQPVFPQLTAGVPIPTPDSGLPPVPAAIGAVARAVPPAIQPMPGDGSGLRVILPTVLPRPVPLAAPSDPPAMPLAQPAPPPPAAPAPLITGRSAPRITAPPDAMPPPEAPPAPSAAIPLRGAAAPLADVPEPGRAPAPPASGPQVAFILDGASDAPLPGWLRARATRGDGDAMVLEGGGAIFADPDAAAGDRSARVAGTPALLVYARLDRVDDVAFDRIALRARRDGVVAVLVAPDVPLWDRIGDWLDGPARDLAPIAARHLLD